MPRPRLLSARALAFLSVVAGAALVSVWVLGRPAPLALGGDNATLTHPLLTAAYRRVTAHALPLWTAGRWGGSPLAGDPVAGALYVPRYLGYALTAPPHARALDVDACAHLAVLATGTVWLLLGLGIAPAIAVAGAVLVALEPTLVYVARSWAQYWSAIAWWPWLLGATLRPGSTRRPGLGVLAAASLAAQVYAGYPQFALYSGTVALAGLVLAPGPDRLRRIGVALVVGAGAVGLAAPQLVAAASMARDSVRGGPSAAAQLAAMDVFALHREQWQDALRATPMSPGTYFKIAPCVVVLAALGAARGGFVPRYLAIVAATAAFLATAPAWAFRLLHSIPPFSFFGGPVKLFYLAVLLATLAAGAGLGWLREARGGWARGVLGAVAVAAVAPWSWSAAAATGLAAACVPAAVVPGAAVLLATSGSAAFLLATRALEVPQAFSGGPYTVLLERSPATLWPAPPSGRWIALAADDTLRQVGMNFGALWDLDAFSGVGPLSPWRQIEILEAADPERVVPFVHQLGADVVVVPAGSALETALAATGFRALPPVRGLRALVAPATAPRYALVPHGVPASATEAVAAGRVGEALTDERVVIEASPGEVGADDGDARGRIVVRQQEETTARLDVTVARPTWLVAREPYYREWEATVDGRPTVVQRAGGFFLGLRVPPGPHEVVLTYRQRGLGRGALAALATLIVLPWVLRRLRAA